MDERHLRRVAQNEARFREANERAIAEATDFHAARGSWKFEVMCECPITECTDMLPITLDGYTAVRSRPVQFVVLPEHVVPPAERVLGRTDDYWIIEKLGASGDEAESLDT